jgi:hypothetical protein
MKPSRFADEQIIGILRAGGWLGNGRRLRKHGISSTTFELHPVLLTPA